MKHIDSRKEILFNAVKTGRVNDIDTLVDLMIFLGFGDSLKGRCLKMERVNSEQLGKLGIVILTGAKK